MSRGWTIYNSQGIPLVTSKAHDHTAADGSGPLTDDEHDGYSEYDEIGTPSSPAANKMRAYPVDVGGVTGWAVLDSAGEETVIVARTRYLWLPPDVFSLATGAVTLETRASWAVDYRSWTFPGTGGVAGLIAQIIVPADWVSGTVVCSIFYQGQGADLDDRRIGMGMTAITPGTDAMSKAVDTSDNSTVAHANGVCTLHTFGSPLTVAAGDIIRATFSRNPGHVTDTNEQDMSFLGMRLEYTAFF